VAVFHSINLLFNQELWLLSNSRFSNIGSCVKQLPTRVLVFAKFWSFKASFAYGCIPVNGYLEIVLEFSSEISGFNIISPAINSPTEIECLHLKADKQNHNRVPLQLNIRFEICDICLFTQGSLYLPRSPLQLWGHLRVLIFRNLVYETIDADIALLDTIYALLLLVVERREQCTSRSFRPSPRIYIALLILRIARYDFASHECR
jgi:hypothetical protein